VYWKAVIEVEEDQIIVRSMMKEMKSAGSSFSNSSSPQPATAKKKEDEATSLFARCVVGCWCELF